MSLKAGRVGVNPADVDPVDGHIKSDATSGYTKQEADAKFETQTHAASTYETKSDATTALAEKQPKTLQLPIETLYGTKLTVEDSLQAINTATVDDSFNVTYEEGVTAYSAQHEEFTVIGKLKNINVLIKGAAGNANEWIDLFTVPTGYRAKIDNVYGCAVCERSIGDCEIIQGKCRVRFGISVTATNYIRITATYV